MTPPTTRSRRELLLTGGAGAAALAFPSFLPTGIGSTAAVAQGRGLAPGRDAMLEELTLQFQRTYTGLSATPPRGSAHQLASLYRMLAAWAKANNLDDQGRQAITDGIALAGSHQAFVDQLASFDRLADARKRGIPVPPNVRNPDAVDIAKAIAVLRAGKGVPGASYDAVLRRRARMIEKHAARFDHQMAIANGDTSATPAVRLIRQDVGGPPGYYDEPQPEADCYSLENGQFECYFTTPTVVPDDPPCRDLNLFIAFTSFEWTILCLVSPEFCLLGALSGFGWQLWRWYLGC